ncbi:response regulator transcription factor [Nonomuraea sp. K274]|uniref:Response regulator transcription factor n=1 Tax=Nonomuraea cypriaca TaxID=1187855 RepID=A0A931A3L9_9ACTN|nr:response regulator transcription factor [Nonomuraea cypriaca]MBF8184380.1 response regulator transcription factor [Nonomuraea cypriaca]
MRCLIVDDNDHFLQAARGLLEREGITVVGVSSTSAEAMERFGECRPDVTLIDVQLGEECGFELARRLAGQRAEGPSNVILISAYSESDFSDLIAQSTALAFLSKSDLSAEAIHAILRRADHKGV